MYKKNQNQKMLKNETKYFERLRNLIEKKLNWKNSKYWTHKDFINLSNIIHDETDVLLNYNTLKRIWNRINYSGNQSTFTKDTLVQFIGYNNWYDFLSKEFELEQPTNNTSKRKKRIKYTLLFLTIVFLTGIYFFYQYYITQNRVIDTSQIMFYTINPTDYPPHHFTVFYDLQGINAKNIIIKPDYLQETHITSDSGSIKYFYLLPGYAKVRLIADGQVLKTLSVHTITNNWLALSYSDMTNVKYFQPDSNVNILTISSKKLSQLGIDTNNVFYLSYYNMQDYEISGDTFQAEARVRNLWTKSLFSTGTLHFGIWGEYGVIDIHVANKGQPYIIKQTISEKKITAKKHDMQQFTLNMNDWNTIKLEVKNKTASIFINNTFVLESMFTETIGMIKGIWFRSKGVGEIDYVHLKNDSLSYHWDEF